MLLEELLALVEDTEQEARSFTSAVKVAYQFRQESRSSILAESFLERDDGRFKLTKSGPINPDKSKVLPKAPLHSFPKAARFESVKERDEPSNHWDSLLTDASVSVEPAKMVPIKTVGGVIPRDKRFEDIKAKANCDPGADYFPNFDAVFKKPATVVIKREENKEQLQARRLERRLKLFADMTVSCKAELSVLTADTLSGEAPGPGAYAVNYRPIEVSRTLGLPKAQRFSLTKKDDKTPLQINYKWVQQGTPGVTIQKEVGLNDKLEKLKKIEEIREIERAQRIVEAAKQKRDESIKLIVQRKKISAEELEKRQPTEKERLFELFRLVNLCKDNSCQ